MLRETVAHLRDLPRYRQILAALIRYGYRDVVEALRLEGLAKPFERAALGDDVPPRERPMRLRMICEDLGPTFVKLGQIMSTRPDLLPEAYTTELAKLRDAVKPFPFAEVEAILLEEFGRPAAELFASIDPVPVAAASISQVHSARTRSGRLIALKIRRPGIEKLVHADLEILKNLAQLAERRLPFLAPFGPLGLVREMERSLKRELDLSIERRTIERCRVQLSNEPAARVPEVFRDFCTSRVLAMEFIDGVAVNDLPGLRRIGADPAQVAVNGARILLTQIFDFGFFQADPHPGNLRVLPGGIIAPLDYGMFGSLDGSTRERIADFLIALINQDTERVVRDLELLDVRGDSVDAGTLRRDVSELVAAYSDLSLDNIDLAQLLHEVVELVRSHALRIPPNLVLLIRSLVTIESVGRTLDPHFDIGSQVEPFIRRLAARRLSPLRLISELSRATEDARRIATLLPDVLGHALESVKRGELTVRIDVPHLDGMVAQITRAASTLAAGVLCSGLIVASALVLRSGFASLAYSGFGLALFICAWLGWNRLRGN